MLNLEKVISKQVNLPSAPAIVHQLTTLMSRDDVGSHEIARIVETDQAFTARTLKLVNSPFYGFSRQITSVEEAVTMLGIGTIQQLLLATSVVSSLGTNSSVLSMDEFRLHSFSVGILAKHLLRAENSEAENEAFMCGVLHDIGRLLFVKIDSGRFARFCGDGESIVDLDKETQWFGANHQQLGQALAQKWNFPDRFATTIAHHHTPDDATEAPRLVAAIHIADVSSHALNLGFGGSPYVTHFSPTAWHKLELDSETYEKIVRRALSEIDETEAMIHGIC
ncbi:MAG: HDOD domain-containing protein [candidate division Zixibacteria bacterium]|nr:HDOD domain-containing protein [candidate division Zixibacteria bacterium]